MSLTDYVEIHLSAGDGGDGVVRWRREKYIPKGGPAGGDGGRGGSVYAVGVKDNTLLQRYVGKKHMRADSGHSGGAKSLYGEKGDDLVLEVPIGTIIKNQSTDETYDIDSTEKVLLLRGGRGGLGNIHFKSSTNQAPREQTDGESGESALFSLELRLIADAGLIGLPSAGKSTLLNFLTGSRSRVAEYHFTTLEPHLGKLEEFVLADIPGLISGASEGKGLGHKFLRHISRTELLLHCISLDSVDIQVDYDTIRGELLNYDSTLADKTEQVILTKSDVVSEVVVSNALELFPDAWVVSVLDDKSLKQLRDRLVQKLRN